MKQNFNDKQFLEAVAKKDTATVSSLLLNGADINAKDNLGRTALHIAAAQCDLSMVMLLVKNDAYVLALDSEGKTPRERALPAPANEINISDDSYNRLLGLPTRDDLAMNYSKLLDVLTGREILAQASEEERKLKMSNALAKQQQDLREKADKNRLKFK